MNRQANREKLLQLLQDQRWHSILELVDVAGLRYSARLHELRRQGYTVETTPDPAIDGALQYRLAYLAPGPTIPRKVKAFLDPDDARAAVAGTLTQGARDSIRAGVDSYLHAGDSLPTNPTDGDAHDSRTGPDRQ